MPTEHEPNQPDQPDDDDERAWEEALLRARSGLAQAEAAADAPADPTTGAPVVAPEAAPPSEPVVAPEAAPPSEPEAAEAPPDHDPEPPIELTHVHRKRRTTKPREPVLPPQQVSVRRRRQTGTMSLATPEAAPAPPADLAPPAPAPAPPADLAPPAPADLVPPAPAPPGGSARARERSREREALERVLALAKPRTRQARPTPAVLPPRPLDDGADSDGGPDGREH